MDKGTVVCRALGDEFVGVSCEDEESVWDRFPTELWFTGDGTDAGMSLRGTRTERHADIAVTLAHGEFHDMAMQSIFSRPWHINQRTFI